MRIQPSYSAQAVGGAFRRVIEIATGLVTLIGALLCAGMAVLGLVQVVVVGSVWGAAGALVAVVILGVLAWLGVLTGWYLITGNRGTDAELFPWWALYLAGIILSVFAVRRSASVGAGLTGATFRESGARYLAAARSKRRSQGNGTESAA